MKKYYVVSSQSKDYFFDCKHKLVEDIDGIKFTYDETNNPNGIYAMCLVEAENEFLAGIEFVRSSFFEDELADLMSNAIEYSSSYGEVSKDLSDLIQELNYFLPEDKQLKEGVDYEVESL